MTDESIRTLTAAAKVAGVVAFYLAMIGAPVAALAARVFAF